MPLYGGLSLMNVCSFGSAVLRILCIGKPPQMVRGGAGTHGKQSNGDGDVEPCASCVKGLSKIQQLGGVRVNIYVITLIVENLESASTVSTSLSRGTTMQKKPFMGEC